MPGFAGRRADHPEVGRGGLLHEDADASHHTTLVGEFGKDKGLSCWAVTGSRRIWKSVFRILAN